MLSSFQSILKNNFHSNKIDSEIENYMSNFKEKKK
jgi:hypothetical protein